jgi:hypothetical protein
MKQRKLKGDKRSYKKTIDSEMKLKKLKGDRRSYKKT